ncbi:MAG: polysaccharide deacetylase family protein, partial [Candidatus Atribacteria bacterium]|nr:polysaccharide deacetylase family protein [Candidatus Atribacteria bacterium]
MVFTKNNMNNKDIIRKVINFLKLPEMYRYFRKRIVIKHIIVFAYHRVYPGKDNLFVKNVCPEEFEKQVKYLKENFKIYSLEKLINLLSTPKIDNPIKENIAVITFDDGYKDNYIYAYPILKKYQVPATIFLISGFIGKDELFWWDKIGYIISNSQKRSINIPNFGDFSLIDNQKKLHCISFLLGQFKNISNQLKNEYIINLQKICDVTIPSGLAEKIILSWDEIREMSDNGISFGAHT